MKKTVSLFPILLMLAVVSPVAAQDVFDKGTNVINAGLGFGNIIRSKSTFIVGVGVDFDHCIIDGLINGNASIGIGGYLGTGLADRTTSSTATISGKTGGFFDFGSRGTFHYQFVDNLDTYAGVAIGARVGTYDSFSPSYPFVLAGARYYMTENFAWMAEVGGGGGFFKVGASFRF